MAKTKTHNADGSMRWSAIRYNRVTSKDGVFQLVYIYDVPNKFWYVEENGETIDSAPTLAAAKAFAEWLAQRNNDHVSHVIL